MLSFYVVSKEIRYKNIDIPDQSGQAITVLGPINPDDLGHTIMHEHLFIDYWVPLEEPDRWSILGLKVPRTEDELALWNESMSAENRTRLAPYFHLNQDAFSLGDTESAITEVRAYQGLGGQTIVDVTTIGLNRKPKKLQQVSKKTGAHIVMGTGFYRRAWHPKDMDRRSLEDLTLLMVSEIAEGVDETGIRAGIIGEIPAEHLVFEPNDSNEVRVLRASAYASQLTGAAISLHSDFGRMQNLHLSLDILEEEGADLSRVILGHITNITSANIYFLESLLRRGIYLQFDVLGNPWEMSFGSRPMVDAIEMLISLGYSKQILVSHDVCSKVQLTKYGGYGFTFVHSMLIPHLRSRGVSEVAIKNIMENNPKRILTFVAPKNLSENR